MNAPINLAGPPPTPIADDWPVGVPQPPSDLPYEDDQCMESSWHRDAMNLLIELIRVLFLGRSDYYVGGNMFVHFSAKQVRNQDFQGPDVFLVKDVDGSYQRLYWAIWEEDGRFPDLIIELLSPQTAKNDRTTKKDIYERTFKTAEYFIYDPATERLEGWRLGANRRYQPLKLNERGWLWSEELNMWLGTWRGHFNGDPLEQLWLRFFNTDGELIPLFAERAARAAEKEKERAEKEKERAAKAEAEVSRLTAMLTETGRTLPKEGSSGEN